ncbi:M15 family metallopeptidase [Nocardiopsis sp. CC223A]|uniref:M15 family metallopeptidase n=1 Tax=Nocardiopsis sp. CC223A TaxID=3044051 RepID=UPI002795F07A|nr:M15 family metallopeptidase [Nocardiopsis sp. CC223A]
MHRWAATAAVASVLVSGGCAAPGGDGGTDTASRMWDLPGGSGPLTEEDGYVPVGEGLEVDADVPALTGLDPELLEAVQEAAADALDAGVDVVIVTGGWRSERYQEHLWEEALREHRSEEEARRWVASPEESAHVSGDAVDIGYTNAADWFSRFGHGYGLCRTYANEMWHYELAVEPGEPCPPPIADASEKR